MIYQSMSGDAEGTQGIFTMTGGSLNYAPASGPLFYVTNSTAVITLKEVTIASGSPLLVKAAAGNWGKSGVNGGTVLLTAESQNLTGDMTADSISAIQVTLKNSSSLAGALSNVSLTLASGSVWNVTGDSALAALVDEEGLSADAISNINGNGYTVTYDAGLPANSALNGQSYQLAGGGVLVPASGAATAARQR